MPGLDGPKQQQDQQDASHHGIDGLRAQHHHPAVGAISDKPSDQPERQQRRRARHPHQRHLPGGVSEVEDKPAQDARFHPAARMAHPSSRP
jgi:hypothetical protein